SNPPQSLLRSSPSTWWAALAVPQRKPSGKRPGDTGSLKLTQGPPRTQGAASEFVGLTLCCFSTFGGGTYSQGPGLAPSRSPTSIPDLSTALRYISRSLCGRPSSTIHAACSGS